MFKEYLKTYNYFNEKFINYFESDNIFNQALNYAIEEGKRIRPIILLETYRMLSKEEIDETVLNFAISLEFIHNYSLIHDDLPAMDDDDYRRCRLTVHKKFREDIAILSGDALLNKAYEIILDSITKSNDLENILNISKAGQTIAYYAGDKGMIKGQVMDVLELSNSEEDIVELYKGKTCGLLMAATTCAAYLANAEENVVKDMRNLGFYVGMAFQLQDDVIDLEQDQAIDKKTYLTYKDVEQVKILIETYSNKATEILENYTGNEFLKELIKKLIERDF